MSERGDRELVELARAGDGAAIGELFSRYWRAARAVAYAITGELASAEDAAAEGFRQALAGIDSLKDPERFGSWLRTIVVRKARLEVQARQHSVDAAIEEPHDQNERPDRALERIELAALIHEALRELPDGLREAVALVYFEGYDSESAARFLDIPSGTLRRRLHDSRKRLRRAVERIFERSKRMNEREDQIRRLKSMIEDGEIYQMMRELLALRPPPAELVGALIERRKTKADTESMRAIVHAVLSPSGRASDPNHPVGAVAAAIRTVLPEFEEWRLDAAQAAIRFMTLSGEGRDRLRAVLPPGFAEERPGAFLRVTRGFVRLSDSGPAQSIYQVLQDSPDEQTFTSAIRGMRISDVLDLTWMSGHPLELRSVQDVLERLSTAVLPGATVRFSSYDEPRYRSALQLQIEDSFSRLAHGGVLAEWPGRPRQVDAAYVRIFLEPWASVRSGQVIDFERIPEKR